MLLPLMYVSGMLRHCLAAPSSRGSESLATATGTDRRAWAALRADVASAAGPNAHSLAEVEGALLHVVLSDAAPATPTEATVLAATGDDGRAWFDKSVTLIVAANGRATLNLEHSPCDGTVRA